jgi:hypothetical protein
MQEYSKQLLQVRWSMIHGDRGVRRCAREYRGRWENVLARYLEKAVSTAMTSLKWPWIRAALRHQHLAVALDHLRLDLQRGRVKRTKALRKSFKCS